jgi:hypothetical protein
MDPFTAMPGRQGGQPRHPPKRVGHSWFVSLAFAGRGAGKAGNLRTGRSPDDEDQANSVSYEAKDLISAELTAPRSLHRTTQRRKSD